MRERRKLNVFPASIGVLLSLSAVSAFSPAFHIRQQPERAHGTHTITTFPHRTSSTNAITTVPEYLGTPIRQHPPCAFGTGLLLALAVAVRRWALTARCLKTWQLLATQALRRSSTGTRVAGALIISCVAIGEGHSWLPAAVRRERINDAATRAGRISSPMEQRPPTSRAQLLADIKVTPRRPMRYQLVQPATMPVLPGQLSGCLAVEDLRQLQRSLKASNLHGRRPPNERACARQIRSHSALDAWLAADHRLPFDL